VLNEVVLTTSAETSLRGRSEMLVDVDAAQQQHQRQLMESSGSFNWSSASQSAAGRPLMRQDHVRGSAESLVTKVSVHTAAVGFLFVTWGGIYISGISTQKSGGQELVLPFTPSFLSLSIPFLFHFPSRPLAPPLKPSQEA